MTKLSALIVAHNEEAILNDCLKRLAFADEIVVVLDRCTDQTKDIALFHGAKIIEGAWDIEGERRMTGIEACAGPWILEVDADEWVEEPLAQEISAVVVADTADFYFTPIHNYVHGRWVKHGWMAALAPDLRGSLFRKDKKAWARTVSTQGSRSMGNGVLILRTVFAITWLTIFRRLSDVSTEIRQAGHLIWLNEMNLAELVRWSERLFHGFGNAMFRAKDIVKAALAC